MIKEFNFRITPERIHDQQYFKTLVEREMTNGQLRHVELLKRSIDARKRQIFYNLKLRAYIDEDFIPAETSFIPKDVSQCPEVAIIGSGPAGLFAALEALRIGLKPIVFERGKDVRSRRRDLAKIHKEHTVNPESNYCFGEGGAGTYSDGKLYTRSKKRGDVKTILEWFVHFGADKDIMIDAHPHIGTNKLPKIIESIREQIIDAGGEVHFNSKLTDVKIENNEIKGLVINETQEFKFDHLIMATGHSARDIFSLLHEKGVELEAKPFALGVRIEHSQELIDRIQYHGRLSDEYLPPAAYSLTTQVDGVGVHSFCMCPGGIVAPCATDVEEVVTNGWSPSKRNNPYSNSGIVVQISPDQLEDHGVFTCLEFQKKIEHECWLAAGSTQAVPAQRLIDFLNGKKSEDLPKTSYQPGLVSVDLSTILPPMITDKLKKAFQTFGRQMDGFMTNDAVLHAPESRTSSPVRIPRDRDSNQHPGCKGLYPCGEGAGYAGGIISAAVDGINCMRSVAQQIIDYQHEK